jgi:hypothetical protein
MLTTFHFLVLGSILHRVYGAVLPLPSLNERSFTCPSQVSAAQNITLPDPDPSVNGTIQTLNTANLTFYNPTGSTNTSGLSTDDTVIDNVSFKLKIRELTTDSALGLFNRLMERASSGGGSSSSARVSSSSSSSSSDLNLHLRAVPQDRDPASLLPVARLPNQQLLLKRLRNLYLQLSHLQHLIQ